MPDAHTPLQQSPEPMHELPSALHFAWQWPLTHWKPSPGCAQQSPLVLHVAPVVPQVVHAPCAQVWLQHSA